MIATDALAAYAARRNALLAAMGEGIALIPTSHEAARNRDSLFPFRHDSYFYYLTGFAEPEAVLVLIAGPSPRTILFCREKNLDSDRPLADKDNSRVGL
jgi:Xaa-Pro aminopeptidase